MSNSLSNCDGASKPRWLFILYSIGILLVMYKSQSLMFTRPIPESLIYLYGAVISCVFSFIILNKIKRISAAILSCIFLIVLIYVYDLLFVIRLSFLGGIILLCSIVCSCSVLLLPYNDKRYLLNLFTKFTSILILISLFGWILFLLKVPLPHYTNTSHPYYIHTIYYLFNLNGYPELQFVPRFAGMFLEPGHLGTMCVFLLYLNNFRLKNILNLGLLLGVLLSLSLAAYGLLVGSIILVLYQKGKTIWITLFASLFITIGILSTVINNGDNPIYEMIFKRLEVTDDGDIKGNNRTSKVFDYVFDRYLKTDKIWIGYGRESLGRSEDGSQSLTIGCATYKRYFFLRGVFGTALIVLLLLIYWWKYRSIRTSGFLIIYIVANIIRDYPSEPIWLYIYLMALPLLKNEKHEKIALMSRP